MHGVHSTRYREITCKLSTLDTCKVKLKVIGLLEPVKLMRKSVQQLEAVSEGRLDQV